MATELVTAKRTFPPVASGVENPYHRLARGASGYRTSALKLLGNVAGNSKSPTALRL
jgi:hypothetical protein